MAEPHDALPSDPNTSLESPLPDEAEDTLTLTIHYHGRPIPLPFPADATISDLSTTISEELSIPPANQKFLVLPKPGLLRPPFKDPLLALSTLTTANKITLLGSTAAEVADIDSAITAIKARQAARRSAQSAGRKVTASRHRDWKTASEGLVYTFATLRPLPHLRNPEKSLRYLERLRDDAGIKAAMRKHKFSVGLLTEMDPAEHTTHESRTLGLNRNRGEVIELRLRTDAYDGYRDYKTIRKTLCHELAHNVVGPHNAEFHALWNLIEKEVNANDWSRGGQSLGGEFHNPADGGLDDEDDEHCDGGGWEGGSYVLGGNGQGAAGGASHQPLSRREIMAKAAEERMKAQERPSKTKERDTGGDAQ